MPAAKLVPESGHRASYSEDRPRAEQLGQTLRDDSPVLEQMLQRPEGHLGIIGRQSDPPPAGMMIGQVVPDRAETVCALPGIDRFAGVAQGVANGETEEHPLDSVECDAV